MKHETHATNICEKPRDKRQMAEEKKGRTRDEKESKITEAKEQTEKNEETTSGQEGKERREERADT